MTCAAVMGAVSGGSVVGAPAAGAATDPLGFGAAAALGAAACDGAALAAGAVTGGGAATAAAAGAGFCAGVAAIVAALTYHNPMSAKEALTAAREGCMDMAGCYLNCCVGA